MSRMFHQKDGDVIEMIAAADVTVDDFIDVGGNLGVALGTAATGEKVSVKVTGVINAPKAAEAHSFGDVVTANTTTNEVALAGGDVAAAGVVVEDSGSGAATVKVRLNA